LNSVVPGTLPSVVRAAVGAFDVVIHIGRFCPEANNVQRVRFRR
jgi:hypothetical protein